LLESIQRAGRLIFRLPQTGLDWSFGNALNPLRHLGALTIFFLWIVLVSGIWLFIFFRTSVNGAYESVEYLTHDQWYLGGVMRSLHRYASDAAIVTLVFHVLKEFVYDRYRNARWFSWTTGVPLLWMIIPLGITGYWLVWDQLALYVALTTSELIDALPIFTESMARNFLSVSSLSNRFFTLMAFVHLIGLPIFLVFGIWLHVFRINRPKINPPRALMAGALLSMLALSMVYPALSQGKADPSAVPANLALDWYYLLVYPLMKSWSPGMVWLLLTGFSLLLCLAPWLPPARPPAVARVNLDNCNGCERCVEDCPFGAVEMKPRSDGKKYASEAVVNDSLCLSCGICVGACPTATPFREKSSLVPGIDLPDQSTADLREHVTRAASALRGDRRLLVFGCEGSRGLARLENTETAVISMTCMAQLPPSFVDFILSRGLADGVVLAGCANGDCQYRLGERWTLQRLNRTRDPRLRKRVDNEKIALLWSEPWSDYGGPKAAVAAFRNGLNKTRPASATSAVPKPGRPAAVVLAWGLFAAASVVFTFWPRYSQLQAGHAIISVSFSHAGKRLQECHRLSQQELQKLPPNMRKPTDCPRERHPVSVVFRADNKPVFTITVPPSGFWKDGESNIYQRIELPAGPHRLFIGMGDTGKAGEFDYESQDDVSLSAGQHLVIGFDPMTRTFVFK